MKNYSINIGKSHNILKLMSKPIRNKQQLDLLLLETIKMFTMGNINIVKNNIVGKITLYVDKMNRFIYEIEDKIFSINCPYACVEEEDKYIFKDTSLNLEINSKLISSVTTIIKSENVNFFDEFMDTVIDSVIDIEEDINLVWEVLKSLHCIEYGYIRYDYDEERQEGKIHPLNHLDINFMNSNQYKIGLNNRITLEEFINILDLTTGCYYLSKD